MWPSGPVRDRVSGVSDRTAGREILKGLTVTIAGCGREKYPQ
ncbi:hypothetical protein ABH935_006662 [Catenulispora sp. GAS73]